MGRQSATVTAHRREREAGKIRARREICVVYKSKNKERFLASLGMTATVLRGKVAVCVQQDDYLRDSFSAK